MTSSAKPSGLSGGQAPGRHSSVRSGQQGPGNGSRINPSQPPPKMPSRTEVTTEHKTVETLQGGTKERDLKFSKTPSVSSRKVVSQLERASRAGPIKPSSQILDRSKAFAGQQSATTTRPAGSQFTWVPLHTNHHGDRSGSSVDSSLWKRGPADPSGVVIDLCDRPLLCMSVRGTEAAIGSSDHSVYVVDIHTQKLLRNLHGKRFGHVEWVTCVDFLEDGRIISGGMDNRLCLWDPTGVRCTDLQGHTASISQVKVIDRRFALSASYDKTLLLWDLNDSKQGKSVGCLQGHRGAVLSFAVNSEGGIVSGSRDGEIFLWDGRDGRAVLRCKGAHDGHVTAVECLSVPADEGNQTTGCQMLFVTGGQDGILRVWDKRVKAPVQAVALSRLAKGKGAITDISITSLSKGSPPLVVAASADKVIRVLEPRSSFQALHVVRDHTDFIYSLHTSGSLMWSGGGDGNVLVHDLVGGSCLYGLGATRNGAPRCISLVGPQALAVAGDDGNCMIYSI